MSSTASGAEGGRGALLAWAARLLPAIVFLAYAIVAPGLPRGEGAGVYVTAAALAGRGSFALDGYLDALAPQPPEADAPPAAYPRVAGFAGHYYLARPPGLALLATPLYLIGELAAPILGAQGPIVAVTLLAPLLAAAVCALLVRLLREHGARGLALAALVACLGLPLSRAQPVRTSLWLVAAILALLALFAAARLLGGRPGAGTALALGALAGSAALFDYGLGLIAAALLGCFLLARLWRRDWRSALLMLAGAALPLGGLAAWQTALFGLPWRPAFRVALDPAERSLGAVFRPARNAAVLAPVDWLAPAALAALAVVAALVVAVPWATGRLAGVPWRRVAPLAALALAVVLPPPVARAGAAASEAGPDDYLAPFATAGGRAVWEITGGRVEGGALRLDAGGSAVAPWVEARAGLVYAFGAVGAGALRAVFRWEDAARNPLSEQAMAFPDGAGRAARVTVPPGAAGLRLRLAAPGGAATVADARLALVGGVRVEPFPDRQRAALAFSFDWESAMGGLIHSRSAGGEGEGATVGLRPDGGPSVADAEAKGLRMREGARYLAALFAQYHIRATFYATGYNLLDGNPTCRRFLGDPVYRNANQSNGWGSDWWRTHPWYGDDPCATEERAPAWYFASETRALAAAGHEIASHSFGHLYVRGVSPEQLAADLSLWNESAAALGLPPARSFAFPWTSSNSLTPDFWAVFAAQAMTTLTRLYPPDLRHPYELARLTAAPDLLIFPDFYLASNAKARDEALARIDATIAGRGYHSLWNHPNEALEQDGRAIWQQVVEYAAAQRERGLWIAPVGEIAAYGVAARGVAATALPVAGGVRVAVENRSGARLVGLTLGLPLAGSATIDGGRAADAAGGNVVLPPLEPGARAVVVVRR